MSPMVADMLTTSQFRAHASSLSYPQAGSFAWYLIETYGLRDFLAQFSGASPNDPASSVRSRFRSAFGFNIERAESEWHDMLDRGLAP